MSGKTAFAIPIETGGPLSGDRNLFKFGKRVQSLILTNTTGSAKTFEMTPHPESSFATSFYWPDFKHQGQKVEIQSDSYFYLTVPANDSRVVNEVYFRRGLRVRGQGDSGCYATVTIHDVLEGDASQGKA